MKSYLVHPIYRYNGKSQAGPANLLYCMYCIVSVLSPCTGSAEHIFGSILILYKNKKKLGDDTLNNLNIEVGPETA